jgi:hypothetical protein
VDNPAVNDHFRLDIDEEAMTSRASLEVGTLSQAFPQPIH